jgi:tetratricopeptide (TPR) repeat protein
MEGMSSSGGQVLPVFLPAATPQVLGNNVANVSALKAEFLQNVRDGFVPMAEACLEKIEKVHDREKCLDTAEALIECRIAMAAFCCECRELTNAKEQAFEAVAIARAYPHAQSIKPLLSTLWSITTRLRLEADQVSLSEKKSYFEDIKDCCEKAAEVANTSEDTQAAQKRCQAARTRLIDHLLQLGETYITQRDFVGAGDCLTLGLEEDLLSLPPNLPRRGAMLTAYSCAQLARGRGFTDLALSSSTKAVSCFSDFFGGSTTVGDADFAGALWQCGRAHLQKGILFSSESPSEKASHYGKAADCLLVAADIYKSMGNEEHRVNCLKERLEALQRLTQLAEKQHNQVAAAHHRHVAELVQHQLQCLEQRQPAPLIGLCDAPRTAGKDPRGWVYLYSGCTTSGDTDFAHELLNRAEQTAAAMHGAKNQKEAGEARKGFGRAVGDCWAARATFSQAGPQGKISTISCSALLGRLLIRMAACDQLLANSECADRRLRLAYFYYQEACLELAYVFDPLAAQILQSLALLMTELCELQSRLKERGSAAAEQV